MFDVFSVKRMYNITVNTGKNDLIFTKNDDAEDDDNHKLGYSFLHLMSGLTKSSVSVITTCRQTTLIMLPSGQTVRQSIMFSTCLIVCLSITCLFVLKCNDSVYW